MTLVVSVLFTQNAGDPATGLALGDIDITLRTRVKATGVMADIWATQNPTEEVGGGLYSRALAGEDEVTFDYFGWAQYTGAVVLDSIYSLYSDSPGTAASVIAPIVADAVWDEMRVDHVLPGSFGAEMGRTSRAVPGIRGDW